MSDSFDDRLRDGYCLSANPSRVAVEVIHQWLSTEAYWAAGRSLDDVVTSISQSNLYVVVSPEGEAVACARMVTDQVNFGWVCDVFVDAAYRGRGIGTWMVGEVVDHWLARGVRRVLLATRDAHEVYARVGFTPLAHPERMMEVDRRPRF